MIFKNIGGRRGLVVFTLSWRPRGWRFESPSFLFFRRRDAFVSLVSGRGEIRRDAQRRGPEGETAREEEEGIRKWNEATGYEKG